jgi:Tol biopolymer transport system component
MTRLTFDPGLDSDPIWTADGGRIVYASARAGATNIFWQSADGTGSAEGLTKGPNYQLPGSVTPDGRLLIFREGVGARAVDLRVLTLDERRETRPLLQAALPVANGEMSPDGRWLAYQSDESGRPEIFVRPFPDVNGGRWQVSTTGGTRPAWARDGRELYYLDRNNFMTVVNILPSSTSFATSSPVKALDAPTAVTIGVPYRSFDVSPDGKRFLVIKDARDSDTKSSATPGLVVVQNWVEELKALLPAK